MKKFLRGPLAGVPTPALLGIVGFILVWAIVLITALSGPAPSKTITRSLGGVGPTSTVTTTPGALSAVENSQAGDHANARDESPTGVTGAVLAAGKAQQERFAARDQLSTLAPLATPTTAGCRSRMVRNYSSRNGIKPRIVVPHLTVSRDQGWTGVNAITAYFDQGANQVSSTYVVSGDGQCNYIVPESQKAWAQAGFNSVAISVEVTATQTQGYYVHAGGFRKLAMLIAGARHRWGIPIRRGAVSGCNVTRSGVVDHYALGLCGGGHNDINPYRAELPVIIHAAQIYYAQHYGPTGPPTAVDRTTCRKLNWWRNNGRPAGLALQHAQRRKAALTSRRVACQRSGPVRK